MCDKAATESAATPARRRQAACRSAVRCRLAVACRLRWRWGAGTVVYRLKKTHLLGAPTGCCRSFKASTPPEQHSQADSKHAQCFFFNWPASWANISLYVHVYLSIYIDILYMNVTYVSTCIQTSTYIGGEWNPRDHGPAAPSKKGIVWYSGDPRNLPRSSPSCGSYMAELWFRTSIMGTPMISRPKHDELSTGLSGSQAVEWPPLV